jgi:hypothetical protein
MAYFCDLGNEQQIYLDNVGEQTTIVCANSQPGQQQQSGSSFTTGVWTVPPQLFQTMQGIFIKLMTVRGETYLQVQGQSLQVLSQTPEMQQAQAIAVSPTPTMPTMGAIPVMRPLEMQPMQPMQPMRMGNMQMSMQPMQMQMGDMQMQMGAPRHPEPSNATSRRFCSSCGTAVKLGDRFCSSCGHNLSS